MIIICYEIIMSSNNPVVGLCVNFLPAALNYVVASHGKQRRSATATESDAVATAKWVRTNS